MLKHLSIHFTLSATIATALLLSAPSAHARRNFSKSVNYRSDSGATQLILHDGPWMGRDRWRIDYRTKVQGQVWSGRVTPTRVRDRNGIKTIIGTFIDNPGMGPAYSTYRGVRCTGTVKARQENVNDTYWMNITWKVTGGKGCKSIGRTIRLSLREDIPKPDAGGDYGDAQVKTWFGFLTGNNEYHTWNRWEVVDRSGSLNCRARPNGRLVKRYRRGAHIAARYDGRGRASAILGADNRETNPSLINYDDVQGAPWMLTQDKCFVRANRQYIQPLSMTDVFRP